MHLTNYAVNKHSKDFIRDEETGSKRYLKFVTLEAPISTSVFSSLFSIYFLC